MSVKNRKKKREYNTPVQTLLTQYVQVAAITKKRNTRRKRHRRVSTERLNESKKMKRDKPNDNVRIMLQKSEGDPKATRGG